MQPERRNFCAKEQQTKHSLTITAETEVPIWGEIHHQIAKCDKREQELLNEHTRMQSWAKNVQSLRDKPAHRSEHQEKNCKFVAQTDKEFEENRKTIEERQAR